MSIWCSVLAFDSDDHDVERCDRWVPCTIAEAEAAGRACHGTDRWHRYDGNRPCTCGCGPLAYRQSHVVPQADHRRSGRFDLATVAPHIGPDGRYDKARDDRGTHLPYLRVSAEGSGHPEQRDTVILDRDQVQQLHEITAWFLANCDPEPDATGGGA